MDKQLENTLLTNYASTRLNAEEKLELFNIAAECGKSQSVILREALRYCLAQSIFIDPKKKEGEDVIAA